MKRAFDRLLVVVAVAVAYEWFVVEAIASEAIAALCVGVVALLALERLRLTAPSVARLSPRFVLPLVTRVLPAAVRESFEVLGPVLWRTLVRREHVTGRWIALRYDPRDDVASNNARRTVVIFGSNLTPNALPLDLDPAAGRLVLHQLLARREDAASDPRYPM